MTTPTKAVKLGKPLTMTEDELAALELPPSQEAIDAAVADWLKYAPARAKGFVFATVDNPIDEVQP